MRGGVSRDRFTRDATPGDCSAEGRFRVADLLSTGAQLMFRMPEPLPDAEPTGLDFSPV